MGPPGFLLTDPIAGGLVGAAVSNFIVAPINAAFTADHFSDQQDAWRIKPIIPPPPSAIFQLANTGRISTQNAVDLLLWQGVTVDPRLSPNNQRMVLGANAWSALWDMSRERPSIGTVISLWQQGYWQTDSARARAEIKALGGDEVSWQRFIGALYSWPDVGVLLEARNRGTITDDQLDLALRRHGYGHDAHRAWIVDQRHSIPPVGVTVEWGSAGVIDPDWAARLRLYDECPTWVSNRFESQGQAKDSGIVGQVDGNDRALRYGDLHWAAHWQQLSVGQAITAYHRLRPDRIAQYRAAGLDVQPFTITSLRNSLAVNNVPPGLRDVVAATSFTLPRLTFVRTALTMGQEAANNPQAGQIFGVGLQQRLSAFTRDWAIAAYQDYGLTAEGASVQADLTIAQWRVKQFAEAKKWQDRAVHQSVQAFIKGYRVGVLTRDAAMTGIVQVGVSAATAQTLIELVDADLQMEDAQALVKAIRTDYLMGGMSGDQAQGFLVSAGLTNIAAGQLVDRWTTQLSLRRRGLATSQVQDFAARGWITVQDAQQRLANLGWNAPDLALLLTQAQYKRNVLTAQLLKAQDAANRKSASDLQKVANDAKKVYNEAMAGIRKATPIGTLGKWLKDGVITPQVYIDRLVAMGYPENIAQLYLQDLLKGKKGKPPTATPTEPPSPPPHHTPPPEGPIPHVPTEVPLRPTIVPNNPPG